VSPTGAHQGAASDLAASLHVVADEASEQRRHQPRIHVCTWCRGSESCERAGTSCGLPTDRRQLREGIQWLRCDLPPAPSPAESASLACLSSHTAVRWPWPSPRTAHISSP